jgi:hypothetical protein
MARPGVLSFVQAMPIIRAKGRPAWRCGATLAVVISFAAQVAGADRDARSRSAFGVEANVGEQRSDLESLSRAVARYGYAPFATTTRAVGLDAYAVGSHARIGVRVDLLTDRPSRAAGAELDAHEMLGLLELGYHLWEHDRAALFPYLGLGFDRLVVTPEHGNLPLLGSIPGHMSVQRDALAVDLGLGLQTSVPFAVWRLPGERPIDKQSCVSFGARVGYLVTAFPTSLSYGGPDGRVDAPRIYTGGYYFRISVGWVLLEDKLDPCDERCPAAPHAKPWCSSGKCSYDCLADYGDCDGASHNGCETPLDTDQNCGGCSVVCGERGHGHTRCVNTPAGPGCVVTHCDAGYASCNGQAEDGCETDLRRDRNNCGACGRRCRPGESCSDGQCRGAAGETPR